MAGKENVVDLVVKARNEASKNLDVITESWKELKASLKDGGSEASKATNTLGQLGNALGTLLQQAKGLSALGTIADNLDRVDKAASESANALNKSSQETKEWSALQAEAAANAKKFRDEVQAQNDVLNRAKATRDAYKKDLAEVNRLVKETERAQNQYNKELARTPRKAPGPVAPSGDTSVFRDAQAARGLQAQVQQQLADQTRTIAATEAELARLNPKLDAAAKYEKDLSRETAKATAEMKRNEAALATVTSEQAKVKAVADQASGAMGGLALRQNEVAAAAAKNAAEIDRTRRAIEALNKFSSGGAEVVDPKQAAALQKQIAAINTLRDDWKALEGEAKRLATGLQTVSGNATQQVDAFKRITDAARRAKSEYFSQVDALDKLRAAAGLPVSGLARVAQAATSSAAANRQLGNSANAALPPIRAMGQAAQAAGSSMESGAAGAKNLDGALRSSTRGGRDALSLFQRIRGEILSLTASYIGLNAAISQIGGVLKAYQTLEAAQSRLGVVFNQDTGKVSKELDFLERNAARLGIEFGVLADQYSKFAVAANAANFSANATRDIFLSVAEAGRVNKLSIDQLNGVFLALEQMISKGKVSSEELRRQLGDRLAGAFNIFAEAIGVSAAELDEMMKKGEVLSDQTTLLKFADELKRRFGPQLGAALASTTAELGRFQNNIFQAQLRVGEGGFIDAFTDGLRTLNTYFQSTEGREFFLSLGAALGNVTRGLVALLPYMDDFARIAGVLVALKVAGSLGNWLTAIKANAVATGTLNREMFTWAGTVTATQAKWNALAGSLTRGTGIIAAMNAQLRVATVVGGTAGARFLALQVAVGGLTRLAGVAAGAFRLLWSAVGGLPGIILTGVTLAVSSWATEVDKTVAAVSEHERILHAVQTAYDTIEGTTKKVADNIKGATLAQALASAEKLRSTFQASLKDAEQLSRVLYAGNADLPSDSPQIKQFRQIEEAINGVRDGTKTLRDLEKVLNDIALNPSDKMFKDIALELLNLVNTGDGTTKSLLELYEAMQQADAVVKAFNGTATDADKALIGTKAATDSYADSTKLAEEKAKKFNEAMGEMGKLIPSVAEELKKLETIKGLEEQYNQAIKFAGSFDQLVEAQKRYQAGMTAVNFGNLGSDGGSAAFNIIKQFEGYRSTPYWDENAYRAGYGSDTVTLSDGSIQKVTQGMTVPISDAVRDLTRRVDEFGKTARDQVGANRFDAFSPQQQGVLTSIAYNYGDLKSTGILDTIQQGTVEQIAEAIRSLAGHNGGINTNRRNQEATLFQSGGDFTEKQFEVERKRLKTQKEYNTGLNERLALQEAENGNAGRLTEEAFVQKKLSEEQKKAKEAGVVLTDEQIAKIQQLAAEEYKISQEKRDQKTSIQEANTALQQAQALEQQRNALMQQYKQAMQTGDVGTADTLSQQILDLNTQIVSAAESARSMWEAIGGPQAAAKLPIIDALITKTQTAAGTIANVGRAVNTLGLTSQQTQQLVGSFADGLLGVFDSFAQAVANGENAFKALGTAFLQFAANFLREIAMMILKQTILNALAGFGGPIGKAASALGGAVAHGGGTIGSTTRSRKVDPGVFGIASYYHVGGVAGLKSNEVPAILERGETIRTEAQESALTERMAAAEQSSSNNGPSAIRNIVVLDEASAANWMESPSGEKVIMGVLGRNKGKLRSLLS
ncbi:tape measure protein [Agrobacterium tumefaciens]|uniref:Tape measure protein n=1 Tax=Agrobacterium tumefaciens TaxID=358 RepID=A0AAJ4T922_AGRTU|nr:tape measure protein [Agrobacterium tumefaciens]